MTEIQPLIRCDYLPWFNLSCNPAKDVEFFNYKGTILAFQFGSGRVWRKAKTTASWSEVPRTPHIVDGVPHLRITVGRDQERMHNVIMQCYCRYPLNEKWMVYPQDRDWCNTSIHNLATATGTKEALSLIAKRLRGTRPSSGFYNVYCVEKGFYVKAYVNRILSSFGVYEDKNIAAGAADIVIAKVAGFSPLIEKNFPKYADFYRIVLDREPYKSLSPNDLTPDLLKEIFNEVEREFYPN